MFNSTATAVTRTAKERVNNSFPVGCVYYICIYACAEESVGYSLAYSLSNAAVKLAAL